MTESAAADILAGLFGVGGGVIMVSLQILLLTDTCDRTDKNYLIFIVR